VLSSIAAFQNAGNGNIFCAYAQVTAPGPYSTAAGMGGPLLWNGTGLAGNKGVNAYLLAVSYGLSVSATVAGALGMTGNTGQNTAPTATTAIDAVANLHIGNSPPLCTPYRVGTVNNAGNFFLPVGMVHTGSLTVDTADDNWVDLGGAIIVSPGDWAAVAASVALTSTVMQIGLVWAEVPN
jgi:hypothetical protein